MQKIELYFATNRAHKGKNRERPEGYGSVPSSDGNENLRFGRVTLDKLDSNKIRSHINAEIDYGIGNGVALADYYLSQMKRASIDAILDNLDTSKPDIVQNTSKLGSIQTFKALQKKMRRTCDVLIYIHGFNVSWEQAVASAMALQSIVNQAVTDQPAGNKEISVVLFSWPSDGKAIPIYSYKSDRSDAEFSGNAFGRGLLKFRDFLIKIRSREQMNGKPVGELLCKQNVHLLCHSMGNYVLQNTVKRMLAFNHGVRLPRLFEHVFMCSPDVDDNVLEEGQPLFHLSELAREVSIYYNRGDMAMYISDYTKQNPDRLGLSGAARPSLLSQKEQQIDCSDIVTGIVEHSYYLNGNVNQDIRYSLAGLEQNDSIRKRKSKTNAWPNLWVMTK